MCFDQSFRIGSIGARKFGPMALRIIDAIIRRRQACYDVVRSPALRSSDRDDRAFRYLRDPIDTPDPEVIRAAIDTVQHELGRALQLIVQALLDHATNDRLLRSNRGVEDRKIAEGTFLPLC